MFLNNTLNELVDLSLEWVIKAKFACCGSILKSLYFREITKFHIRTIHIDMNKIYPGKFEPFLQPTLKSDICGHSDLRVWFTLQVLQRQRPGSILPLSTPASWGKLWQDVDILKKECAIAIFPILSILSRLNRFILILSQASSLPLRRRVPASRVFISLDMNLNFTPSTRDDRQVYMQ